jgi:rubrerythrin
MLAGKGIDNVINMAGGIKAWDSGKAVGAADLGLDLFDGSESLAEILMVAYSLEKALMEFYVSMESAVKNEQARELFKKLSFIETMHQETIFNEYCRVSGESPDRDEFEEELVLSVMEGGLTTEEYLEMYEPDMEAVVDVVGFAMTIEAQALDLYQRAADRASSEENRSVLLRIADEERGHLKQLGTLLD